MEPLEIDFPLTTRCPSRCVYCSRATTDSYDIPYDEIQRFLRTAAQFGVSEVHFTGGEPMLREDLEDIIHDSVSLSIEPTIVTSGIGASKQRLAALSSRGLKAIAVSIDSLDRDIVMHHRRYGHAFSASLKAFHSAVETGLSVAVLSVIMNDSIASIYELTQWVLKNGASRHILLYPGPVGRGSAIQDHCPSPEDWEVMRNRIVDEFDRAAYSNAILMIEKPFFRKSNPEGRGYCKINTRNHALVRYDGEVFPCALLIQSSYSLGNVFKQTFGDVWGNEANWHEYMNMKEQSLIGCGRCEDLQLCHGGCLAQRILVGNLFSTDPRCAGLKRLGYMPTCITNMDCVSNGNGN